MARADYHAQMERHAGEWDVLPQGLVVPTLPHGSDWREGFCSGIASLTEAVLDGNRWPAVSGALLAELALRCATLAALTVAPRDRQVNPLELYTRFRKAIPVQDPRTRPRVGDEGSFLYWTASVDSGSDPTSVDVSMTRRPDPDSDPVEAVAALACFDTTVPVEVGGGCGVERRMSDYLLSRPRRLALPAYQLGWGSDEVRGRCTEAPGSLVAVAEQALGDAGKIIRGDGVPEDEEESMLLADMTYLWVSPVDDACVDYVAHAGARRTDERGRDWVDARAVLSVDDQPLGEASGTLFFRRYRPRR